MSDRSAFELARRIEFMDEREAAMSHTAARACEMVDWGLARGDVVALDLACKWLDVFGERDALRSRRNAIALQLEQSLLRVIGSSRMARRRPLEDLPLRIDSARPLAVVDRVALVGAPDSAKLDLLGSCLVREGLPASALSRFYIASDYPDKLYATSSSAWYPVRSTGSSAAGDIGSPPDVLASLADLEHKARTLVVILGLPRVPARIVADFPAGIVNAHNGMLPDFRGLDSPAWAYAHGALLGYTLHFIDADLDVGHVIVRKRVASGSKTDFDRGIVTDLSAVVRSVLAGLSPVRHRFKKGPYYYRMSLRTRRVLDAICDAEFRAQAQGSEPESE